MSTVCDLAVCKTDAAVMADCDSDSAVVIAWIIS